MANLSRVFKALDAVTATGAGSVFAFDAPKVMHLSVQIECTGAPTTVKVQVEQSLDGVNFHEMVGFELAAPATPPSAGFLSNISHGAIVVAIRANLVTLTGGASPTVTVTFGMVDAGDTF